MDNLKHQPCPICHTKNLTLTEEELDIPFFGKTYMFSMSCSKCKFSKSDVESEGKKDPCKIVFTIEKQEDMKIRVVKSSEASVKIPQLRMSVTPGPDSAGYISNIEGLLNSFVEIIEEERNNAEEPEIKKRTKTVLKKIRKVKWGDAPLKIIIEDPSGNSAIISEKAQITKLKNSRKKK